MNVDPQPSSTTPPASDTAAERWTRVSALLAEAMEVPSAERDAFLATACADDDGLRDEVSSLARALEDEPDRFESGALGVRRVTPPAHGEDRSGSRVGSYLLTRRVGAGGMGDVYEAVREESGFRKRVALKLMDVAGASALVVRRFEQERRILARLEHRNIAALIDGGLTEAGRPYYAMEFVDGEPITEWCENRRLGIEERVALFRQVCGAVEYAHRHLVIHRDLKPGNVFVTEDGTVKLLDFGIAKIMEAGEDNEPDLTQAGPAPLTPAYASPEQLRGDRITTASDIFSLGVLLYEVLAGAHPFRAVGATSGEVRDQVLAGPPAPPSTVAGRGGRVLRGDLDTVVLTALQLEPERRYSGAAALGEDLRRWAAGFPIRARPDSLGYRLGKFVRRNRVASLAVLLGVGALLTGLAAAIRQTALAEAERDRARREAAKATQVTRFMEEMFEAADPRLEGRDVTVLEVLDSAVVRAGRDLAGEPALQAAVFTSIGATLRGLGRFDEAERLLRTSLDVLEQLGDEGAPDVPATMRHLGRVLADRGEAAQAESLFRDALARYRASRSPDSAGMARALDDLGDVLQYRGELVEAEAVHREGLAIKRHTGDTLSPMFAASLNNLAVVVGQQGRWEEAERLHREGLRVAEATLGSAHPDVATGMNALAFVLEQRHAYPQAESLYQRALAIRRETLGWDHPEITWTLNRYGWLLFETGQVDSAASLAREVLRRRGPTLPDAHPMVASTLVLEGRVALSQQRPRDAERALREALTLRQRTLPDDHWLLALNRNILVDALVGQGRYAEAEPLAIESYATLMAAQGPSDLVRREAADRLHRMYLAMGRPAEAARYPPMQP